ncbi:FT-interacting protein 7-like [Abrus precatorius]|uniref:FT-interacting protein 7-like n=1 Tax=Abrus precatorius TaxID=3816 RepID=A0A8B8JQ97_ABRPR|nr:FT-interacting protein 7-like [Abrus precatorius]
MANQRCNDSAPKETSLNMGIGLGKGGGNLTRKLDLVEQMEFLFVKVVRTRDLPNTRHEIYVEIKIGNLKATTCFFENKATPSSSHALNQVFAFEKDKIHDTYLEVLVKSKMVALNMPNAFFGRVQFSLRDVPTRVAPEYSLAPQWYKLEDQNGKQHVRGDIMLSLWMGTQVDEDFPNAWCSDATSMSGDAVGYTRSKVYMSPTLWYLRVNVIQAQDLLFRFPPESSDVFVQVDLGNLRLRTSFSKSLNPLWNEDLMFVAQEPFSDTLVLSVEQGTLAQHVSLGRCILRLKDVDERVDGQDADSRWYNLNWHGTNETEREVKFASKLNARISLDGGYHVMDEPSEYCSDFRPSSRKLWNSSIGVLEVGILKATDLVPMKWGTRTDAYCVAKYGPKWVRTRTVFDSLSPKWNDQYVWEVFEPFTVITIAVFDNNQLNANRRGGRASDAIMGKIRIRVSTLDRGKVYTHSYPLVGLQHSGVKKMGEVHLALRFSWSCMSSLSMFQSYISPLFPIHHHVLLLSPAKLDNLRNQAAHIIANRLSRAEPPLKKEVVYYMLDSRSDMWSRRKAIANFNRVMSLIGDFIAFWKLLERIRVWKDPIASLLFNLMCFLILFYPQPMMPFVIFYLFWVGLKHYFKRPKHTCQIDATLSGANLATPEDLAEELDVFPTQLGGEPLRRSYDRLRIIARNTQRVANDLATLGERVQALSNWRDPRATTIFLLFCVVGFLVTVIVPVRVVIFIWITYYLRHPRFRGILPSVPQNFLKRMPTKQAFIL